jgi:hypothetical protein
MSSMTDNPAQPDDVKQPAGELREIINGAAQRFSTDPITKGSIWEGYIVPEGFMNRLIPTLESFIASRTTALLDELEGEGPKERDRVSQDISNLEQNYINGFNAANAKWRTVLAKAKEQI